MEGYKHLTDDERGYFRDLENLFNSPGWARLSAEWQEEVDGLPDQVFFSANNWEEVLTARTRQRVLMELLNLPEQTEANKDGLINTRETEAEDNLVSRPDV